jgi:Homeodomain
MTEQHTSQSRIPLLVEGSNTHKFQTPEKGIWGDQSTAAATLFPDSLSFEKLALSRSKQAAHYCAANLADLLGMDINLLGRSPRAPDNYTPLKREDRLLGSGFLDEQNTTSPFGRLQFTQQTKQAAFDLSLRKEGFRLEDEIHGHTEVGLARFEYSPVRLDLNSSRRLDNYQGLDSFHDQGYYGMDEQLDESLGGDDFRKRKRKNNAQLKILKQEFGKGETWNKEKITQVAQTTGLSESQVYKWCWDQKKKIEEQEASKTNGSSRAKELESARLKAIQECQDSLQNTPLGKRRPEKVIWTPASNSRKN